MARSLSVKHTEAPSTNSLFTFFLVVCVSWLLVASLTSDASASPDEAPAQKTIVLFK